MQRFLKFCKYLPEFGVTPYVLTVSNPTYPSQDPSLSKEVPDQVNVFKSFSLEPFDLYAFLKNESKSEVAAPTAPLSSGSMAAKIASWIRANVFVPDARAGWLATARRKALNIMKSNDIDCIITTGPPHSTHFIGRYIQKKLGAFWIADFRDPWTQIHYNQILPRTRFIRWFDNTLEKNILRNADEVIVVSPTMAHVQKRIFERNYRVITNGFDPADFRGVGSHDTSHKKYVIRHVGRINEASVPHSFFEALGRLEDPTVLKVEFIGNVHHKVQEFIDQYHLQDCVTIKPYIPHNEAIKAMKSADLLLLVIPDIKDNELILTGKLFDYIGAQKPIMYIGPSQGDAAEVIRELNQGYIFGQGETDKIQAFLSSEKKEDLGLTSTKFEALENHPYSRKKLTQQLVELIP